MKVKMLVRILKLVLVNTVNTLKMVKTRELQKRPGNYNLEFQGCEKLLEDVLFSNHNLFFLIFLKSCVD